MLSDQAPYYIPGEVGIMFKVGFIYWDIFDVMQDCDLEKWYSSVLKSLCKHNITIAT